MALILFELMMQWLRQDRIAMRVTPASYGVLDEHLGVRYEPNTSISYAYLDSNGRVLDCLPAISVTNSDGFRGVDTLQDYMEADHRVIATGDSFSHWNIDGLTLVDYARAELHRVGVSASLLNVAGGTFGLEHMVVHVAAAIERAGEAAPDLVAIQFIRDDITRDWWYLDTVMDESGRSRARLGRTIECLATDSDCGSDEYLIDPRANQEWCEIRKTTGEIDEISQELVDAYRDIRGFFVYVRKAFARIGLIDSQSTSVIPRVYSIARAQSQRMLDAIETIRSSGADILFVYLPTEDEIRSGQIFDFDENERDILQFYEQALGVEVSYPQDFVAFGPVTEFRISPVDGHPSKDLQRAYGRYLAVLFAEALN